MPISPAVYIGIQIGVAVITLIIMYIITLYVLNIDALVNTPSNVIKQKEVTTFVDGYAGPSLLSQIRFNTVNPYTDNYKRVARSANQTGGTSFTYQFWVKIENSDNNLISGLTLIHKGDTKNYIVGYYKPQSGTTYSLAKQLPPAPYIACPSIGFGKSYKNIVVVFNSNNNIMNLIDIDMDIEREPSSRKNLLSLLPVQWTLLTFVFEDNYSYTENSDNGIKFNFYINDVPYWSETASSAPVFRNDFLVQNDGDITFMPDAKVSSEFIKLGNVKYYNYAVTPAEISATYQSGPPSYSASLVTNGKTMAPSYMSALNKVDIYNY